MAPTAASVYAELRRWGKVVLSHEDVGLIPGIRAHAKADGLAVHQFRERARSLSRAQQRRRPYHLDLTKPGSDLIVAPDAEEKPMTETTEREEEE